MDWIKIKIETVPEGLDGTAALFEEAGLCSLEIEDSREFLEVLEQTRGRWDFVDGALYDEKSRACSVSAYVPNTKTGKEKLEFIKSRASGRVSAVVVNEEDWAETWKQYFVPIPVGDSILICPAWEEVPERYSARTVFKIEPGMSFGTGTHESTRLCLAALERYAPGAVVLDLGCGSGILSIVACLLGALDAAAADIDENCLKIAGDNARMNGIPEEKYRVYAGDLTTDGKLRAKLAEKAYDLVLVNIIPEVIVRLLPYVRDVLKGGGVAILSGIIGAYLPEVEQAAKSLGFSVVNVTEENDWQCLEVKKG